MDGCTLPHKQLMAEDASAATNGGPAAAVCRRGRSAARRRAGSARTAAGACRASADMAVANACACTAAAVRTPRPAACEFAAPSASAAVSDATTCSPACSACTGETNALVVCSPHVYDDMMDSPLGVWLGGVA